MDLYPYVNSEVMKVALLSYPLLLRPIGCIILLDYIYILYTYIVYSKLLKIVIETSLYLIN